VPKCLGAEVSWCRSVRTPQKSYMADPNDERNYGVYDFL